MLRDMLLNEDSENSGLYSQEEQEQFLWRSFRHLCLGGACCQYEVRAFCFPAVWLSTSGDLSACIVSAVRSV